MSIHETAVVDPLAEIDKTASIGPYTVVEANVSIGADTVVDAHVVISGHTRIGERNQICSFASIGSPPQDMLYKGEPTELIIGDDNQIREYVSIHRGTPSGAGRTVIGNHNMIMAYCHIAHDCILHDHVIMANVATLGGHVELGDYVNLGGLVAIHQFCRIGAYTYVGGMSGISKDVSPYVMLSGIRNRMRISGINKIGLRRNGVSQEAISCLEKAFKIIFRSPPEILHKKTLDLTLEAFPDSPEVKFMLDFFNSSKRGVIKRTEP